MQHFLHLIIHPTDPDRHPTVPSGWRWAVMVDTSIATRLDACANAGWCPTRQEALLEGEMVTVTVVKAARSMGTEVPWSTIELEYDPIPPERDMLGTPA